MRSLFIIAANIEPPYIYSPPCIAFYPCIMLSIKSGGILSPSLFVGLEEDVANSMPAPFVASLFVPTKYSELFANLWVKQLARRLALVRGLG